MSRNEIEETKEFVPQKEYNDRKKPLHSKTFRSSAAAQGKGNSQLQSAAAALIEKKHSENARAAASAPAQPDAGLNDPDEMQALMGFDPVEEPAPPFSPQGSSVWENPAEAEAFSSRPASRRITPHSGLHEVQNRPDAGEERAASPGKAPLYLGVLLLVCGVAFLGLFALKYSSDQKGKQYYLTLSRQVAENQANAQTSLVDFVSLKTENADTVAWLQIQGAEISLPVVWHGDNSYYLRRCFDGSSNDRGCLFLSGENQPDFSDVHSVIYGHNMHDGTMFGQLLRYQDEAFCQENPTFELFTPNGDYICHVFSCEKVQDGTEVYTTFHFDTDEEYSAFVQGLIDGSLYDTGVVPEEGAKLLTLSTCASAYLSNANRFVVHAWLEPMNA